MNKLILVICALLSGCANLGCNDTDKIGQSWIGATIDDVAANQQWGFPTEETTVLGRKRVTWHTGFTDNDMICNRIFGVNSEGKIQNYQWNGMCDTKYSRWARKGQECSP